jgi:hypothetical protein
MFDYKFIKILLDFAKWFNYCRNNRANFHNMESIIKYNYNKTINQKISMTGNDDLDNYTDKYIDFIRYYDRWYKSNHTY